MTTSAALYHRPIPAWALPFTRLLFVAAICVLTYHSVRPATSGATIPHFDKILHAAAYCILAGLLALAMPRMRLFWIVLLPCLYGAGMEIAQSSMSAGRTGSIYDMLANIGGALFAVGVWIFLVRIYRRLAPNNMSREP